MRDIKEIFIHCSATQEGRSFTAKDIDSWHRQRGYNGIGYHYVIKLDGTVEIGRDENRIGAHAQNFNTYSIGICYIGGLDGMNNPKDTRTPEQTISLIKLLCKLLAKYPKAKIRGHNEVANKACPSFDVQKWIAEIKDCLKT
jgi:N-acetylmuramoyl-L-alanine amidase